MDCYASTALIKDNVSTRRNEVQLPSGCQELLVVRQRHPMGSRRSVQLDDRCASTNTAMDMLLSQRLIKGLCRQCTSNSASVTPYASIQSNLTTVPKTHCGALTDNIRLDIICESRCQYSGPTKADTYQQNHKWKLTHRQNGHGEENALRHFAALKSS